MPIYPDFNPAPFETLDTDWALTCRRNRRSRILERWVPQEPDLAGIPTLDALIPPVGVDRGPVSQAIARLHVAGDDLAARVLLQLLVPGMVRLTASWRNQLNRTNSETGWEIVSRATAYIATLRHRAIRCAPAGYILTSVHRDLLNEAATAPSEPTVGVDHPVGGETPLDARHTVPSAEDTVCATAAVRDALEAAVRDGVLPRDSLDLVWLVLSGYTVAEAADLTQTPYSTQASYRHRAATYPYLYRQLFVGDPGEDRP